MRNHTCGDCKYWRRLGYKSLCGECCCPFPFFFAESAPGYTITHASDGCDCDAFVPENEEEVARLRECIKGLIGNDGIRHKYAGDCPDELQPESRDDTCPACNILKKCGV